MYVKRCKQIRLLNLIVWVGLIHFIACDDSKSNKYNQDTGNEEGGGETVGGAEAGNQTSAGDEQLAGEMIVPGFLSSEAARHYFLYFNRMRFWAGNCYFREKYWY